MKTRILFSMLALLTVGVARAQEITGNIKCLLQDKNTKEVIPFANIVLYKDKIQYRVATTNMDGEALFSNLDPGSYDVKGVYVGYRSTEIKDVKVKAGKTEQLTIMLDSGEGVKLDEVMIVEYQIPQIDPDTKVNQTVTREDYQNLASKDIASIAATAPGAFDNISGEEYAQLKENGFKEVSQEPLSTLSIDVDRASYTNVRRYLNSRQLPPPGAVRIEEMINYFHYDYPQPQKDKPFSVNMSYVSCPWNAGHGLVQVGIKAREVEAEKMPPANFVFLIDVSGSMDNPDKLPLLKSALYLLIDQLRPQDKISIVVYAGNAGLVLKPTSGSEKLKIQEAIAQLSAGGSTAGGEGIMLAYKTALKNFNPKSNNRVILATDGDFNVGVSSDEELVQLIESKRGEGVFLSVLGFGTGNYKDSKMELLADKGNGNYFYIDNLLEAKKVLVSEMGGTLLTVAKDVKIQVEFNPQKVKSYRLVGYENRVLNKEDFNDDAKDAGELGSGHCVTALYEIVPAGSTENLSGVDTLKYQKTIPVAVASNEILTLKTRYKEPVSEVSKMDSFTLADEQMNPELAPENVRFAAAVAEFGMLLRQSELKGTSSYASVIKMARNAKGTDEQGYRTEFIKLAETAEMLYKQNEISAKGK